MRRVIYSLKKKIIAMQEMIDATETIGKLIKRGYTQDYFILENSRIIIENENIKWDLSQFELQEVYTFSASPSKEDKFEVYALKNLITREKGILISYQTETACKLFYEFLDVLDPVVTTPNPRFQNYSNPN